MFAAWIEKILRSPAAMKLPVKDWPIVSGFGAKAESQRRPGTIRRHGSVAVARVRARCGFSTLKSAQIDRLLCQLPGVRHGQW